MLEWLCECTRIRVHIAIIVKHHITVISSSNSNRIYEDIVEYRLHTNVASSISRWQEDEPAELIPIRSFIYVYLYSFVALCLIASRTRTVASSVFTKCAIFDFIFHFGLYASPSHHIASHRITVNIYFMRLFAGDVLCVFYSFLLTHTLTLTQSCT